MKFPYPQTHPNFPLISPFPALPLSNYQDIDINSALTIHLTVTNMARPQSPGRDRQARISIDALLNPAVNEEPQQLISPMQQFPRYLQGPYMPHEDLIQRHEQSRHGPEEPSFTHPPRYDPGNTGAYRYERFDSVSSTATNPTERRRPPRPKYGEEEMYFIWYNRIDLEKEWREVQECYNRQFPERPRDGFQGIQCKFYRFIKQKNLPTVREQRRLRDGEFMTRGRSRSTSLPRYGVTQWCDVWYSWMRPEHRTERRGRPLMRQEDGENNETGYVHSSAGSSSPEVFTPQSLSDNSASPGEL